MTLDDWLKREGKGAIARLHFATGLSYATLKRAREGKVKPEDIEGSTFSISNLGMFAVDNFLAIINPPEAAILAVGAVKDVPVVKDGQLAVGTRMKASISVDHRVSDGVEAARFMQALAEALENPLSLLL